MGSLLCCRSIYVGWIYGIMASVAILLKQAKRRPFLAGKNPMGHGYAGLDRYQSRHTFHDENNVMGRELMWTIVDLVAVQLLFSGWNLFNRLRECDLLSSPTNANSMLNHDPNHFACTGTRTGAPGERLDFESEPNLNLVAECRHIYILTFRSLTMNSNHLVSIELPKR